MLGAVLLLFFGPGIKLGIDFAGGVELQVSFAEVVGIDDLRATVDAQIEGASVQSLDAATGAAFLVRTPLRDGFDAKTESSRIREALETSYRAQGLSVDRVEVVGPQVGEDLRRQGLLSILYAMVGILIYVTLRFEFRYALGAITALFHDVILTVGLFVVLGKEFNLPTIAAILTIIGYSLNDTVVVFDRIRENRNRNRRANLAEQINRSINETLSRTILTNLTVMLTVLSLLFFTQVGSVIHDFAVAMTAGVILGTYSTVFIAAPVMLLWEKKSQA